MSKRTTDINLPARYFKPVVIALVGPTCTGKTPLAIELSILLRAEVIACDSRTVYRHLNIGTAKPSLEEQKNITHHLMDIVEPDKTYTVNDYQATASLSITQILKQDKVPIVCGGTGFYARALLEGITIPAVPPVPELREKLKAKALQEGNIVLHKYLQELDPVSAKRINTNDLFRVIRAIEVSLTRGKPFSSLAGMGEPSYRTIWIGLTSTNRIYLYDRIQKRFEQQMKQGLVEEVEDLLKSYGPCRTLTSTINYKEFVSYLQGKTNLDTALKKCLQDNRQLARRQLIWFRANPAIKWFCTDELGQEELLKQVANHIKAEVS